MRFLLTILVWVVIVGGLWSYAKQREVAEASIVRQSPVFARVEDVYSLHLTPTFSIEPDPFALQTGERSGMAMELRLNGEAIAVNAENLQRGVPWGVEQVEGLIAGLNEIYLQASPPLDESGLEHGVRVQLVKGGVAVVDSTLWAAAGAQVSGTIHFELAAQHGGHKHE